MIFKNYTKLSTMIIALIIFQTIFLTESTAGDYTTGKSISKDASIIQDIEIFQNGSANVHIDLEIENDTTQDFNNLRVSLSKSTQNFTQFDCSGHAFLINGTFIPYEYNDSEIIKSIDPFFGREERTIFFNHSKPARVRIQCRYIIENYANEIRPTEWFVYDEFPNKHSMKYFLLNIKTPEGTILKDIVTPGYLEICKENERCSQELNFRWDGSSDYIPPIVNFRYEKISLNLTDVFRRNSSEFILGGIIAALIAIAFEKIILSSIKRQFKHKKHKELITSGGR